jgi:hypothetical protein
MALFQKYAFSDNCKTELADPDTTRNTLQVSGPCISCRMPQTITVPAANLIKFGEGDFAQNCFPELSADQREFLISGICGHCWDRMFPEEDENAD